MTLLKTSFHWISRFSDSCGKGFPEIAKPLISKRYQKVSEGQTKIKEMVNREQKIFRSTFKLFRDFLDFHFLEHEFQIHIQFNEKCPTFALQKVSETILFLVFIKYSRSVKIVFVWNITVSICWKEYSMFEFKKAPEIQIITIRWQIMQKTIDRCLHIYLFYC